MIVLFDQIDDAGVAIGAADGLAPVPVTDIDAAKAFYVDELGFEEEADTRPGQGVRLVRLTPPGARASLLLAARDGAEATGAASASTSSRSCGPRDLSRSP
jgi:catechol 2,3-dioxygenase-like lactoylglutathione lyase family enzyme